MKKFACRDYEGYFSQTRQRARTGLTCAGKKKLECGARVSGKKCGIRGTSGKGGQR